MVWGQPKAAYLLLVFGGKGFVVAHFGHAGRAFTVLNAITLARDLCAGCVATFEALIALKKADLPSLTDALKARGQGSLLRFVAPALPPDCRAAS